MQKLLSVALLCLLPTFALTAPLDSGRYSLATCGLLYLDDPTFQKDLALTDAQQMKLQQLRVRLLREHGKQTVFGVLQNAASSSAALDKELATVLDDKQRQRWNQLVLHDFCRLFGVYRTVRLPEVQLTLQLDSAQIERLEKGEPVEEVLGSGQRQRWQQLLGLPPAVPLYLTLPAPLAPSWPAPVEADHFQALAQPSVHQELKLSEKQLKELETLRVQWQRGRQELQRLSPEQQATLGAKLLAQIDKGIASALTVEQLSRLQQITRQWRLPRGIPVRVAAFIDPDTRAILKLSAAQQQKVDGVFQTRRTGLQQAAVKQDHIPEFVKEQARINRQAEEGLLAVLDESQRQRLEERFGPPFTGRRITVDIATLQPNATQLSPVPLLLSVVPFLCQDCLATELQISPAQKQQLTELEQVLGEQVVRATAALTVKERLQKRDDAYAAALKTLDGILKPDQKKRLRELLLQHLENPPAAIPDFQPAALTRCPELIKELGLSDVQLTALLEALTVRQVLTAEQWKKWQEMRGKPSKMIESAPLLETEVQLPYRLNYLEEPAIRRELQLSAEQIRKLDAGIARWREMAQRALVWSPAERTEKVPALRKQIRQDLFALLTDEQATRLAQIARQAWLREEGLTGLFEMADTEAALKFSGEQKHTVEELRRERALIDRLLAQQRLFQLTLEELLAFWTPIHEADRARLEKLLTDPQRKLLVELLGKPFTGKLRPHSLQALQNDDAEARLFGFAPPR